MSDSRPLLSRRLDRRAFLGGASIAAGAVVATSLIPLSVVHALPVRDSVGLAPMPGAPVWNGHVDDACGHWPPYAYPIPYSVMRGPESAHALAGNVHPADDFLLMV